MQKCSGHFMLLNIVMCHPINCVNMDNMVFPKAPDLDHGNQLNLERVK